MVLALLLACDLPGPSFVDRKAVEAAYHRGDEASVCVGLDMEDERVRGYSAEILSTWAEPSSCLCTALDKAGKWDPVVLRALAKGEDDAHVGCAATLLDDPKVQDRGELVKILVAIKVPQVEARLKEAAKADADPAVRATAMAVLRPGKDAEALTLVTGALTDPNPAIRAAAAQVLSNVDAAKDPLVAAAKDADPNVRGAALASLRTIKGVDYPALACPALRTDPEPVVRAAVAAAMKGTSDPALLACLREHMLENEDDALVRKAMLDTLHHTSAPAAADMLCEAIPFWVHTYIGEDHPEREGAADIIFAQNNRDMNRSYECVEKAVKAGGYKTCEQKFYVNDWFHELGGKNAAPRPCKAGGSGGGGGGSNEITF
jgi:hypothetical protein